MLATLTPREERVLRMRFGIGMNTDHTLEEVGQQFSVTRERIRQIEAKALRKLKHPSRSAGSCGASSTRVEPRTFSARSSGGWRRPCAGPRARHRRRHRPRRPGVLHGNPLLAAPLFVYAAGLVAMLGCSAAYNP